MRVVGRMGRGKGRSRVDEVARGRRRDVEKVGRKMGGGG